MYFITTIGKDATRCVGYFSTLEKAIKIVENNACDLNEAGYYPYVIIESISEGIYHYDQSPLWFKYSEKTNTYEKSSRPEFIDDHLVGFGIG